MLSCGERPNICGTLNGAACYNSRSPAESDGHGLVLVTFHLYSYNSRSPAENDGMCYTLMTRDNPRYNSRSPAESDLDYQIDEARL